MGTRGVFPSSKSDSHAELHTSGAVGGRKSQRLARQSIMPAPQVERPRDVPHDIVDAGEVEAIEHIETFGDQFEAGIISKPNSPRKA